MITGLIAGLLSLIYLHMSIAVIRVRISNQISYGYGPNNEIAGPVSAHSNFAAYVPLQLLLLYLIETSGHFPGWLVMALGLTVLFGRVLHYRGVFAKKTNFKFRKIGMMLTIFPMLIMSLMNIYLWVNKLIC